MQKAKRRQKVADLPKIPSGIEGLDNITLGGLPAGRSTLVCGAAGCGKTLMAIEFLVKGAMRFNEPGVFVSFEETADDISANVASLGFDIEELTDTKKLVIDYIHLDKAGMIEAGDYDLEGLFLRLGHAIDTIGAKRVVIDTLENLFGDLENQAILRAELRRLFRWLKDRGVTALITAERGNGSLTRHGLEEYVSDCVILLDHRVNDQISTRRLRIVKFRGSFHGTNEYPFLIDEQGITVMPISEAKLDHPVTSERISTGIDRLDNMLGGKGYFRGSSILVSGTSGTGKSTLAAHLAHSFAERGEKALYFAFEESPAQIIRNMKSIGLDLERWVKKQLLQFSSSRPTHFGLEMHLAMMHKLINDFGPSLVILDPINNMTSIGNYLEVNSMLTRLIDFLKGKGITGFFTSLTSGGSPTEATDVGMSSLMDTWLLVRDIEQNGERNRGLHVLKSRGMAHSNQVREFIISDKGINLVDVYLGSEGMLTGSARLAQEAAAQSRRQQEQNEIERKKAAVERRRNVLRAQLASLQADIEAEENEFLKWTEQVEALDQAANSHKQKMALSRKADNQMPKK
ncbi:MAG: circadian clock protein KaiC [Verrucomicrobiales bacterium]